MKQRQTKKTSIPLGLTFDDVLLTPRYSGLRPEDFISTETFLCKGIKIKTPLISAAMDTVTGSEMAIMLARKGGIGVIHRNYSIAEQCKEIIHVKRHQGDKVMNPMTLKPTQYLEDALEIYKEFGFATIPIVDSAHKLLGLITERHFDDFRNDKRPLSSLMVPVKDLTLAYTSTDLVKAGQIMRKNGKKRLPVVRSKKDMTLLGIYFKKDIQNKEKFPNMSVDKKGRLLVAGAVGVGDEGFQRALALMNAGVDILCIDTAQGDSVGVVEMLKRIKKMFPYIPVIAGNVVTEQGARRLIRAGADAIKVGVGPGAICTTRENMGNGLPQFSAILEVSRATKPAKIPLIADGGIKALGDVIKALAAGANSVMMGSVFAGTDETPGDIIESPGGGKFKEYRGMGSLEAMKTGRVNDRYAVGKTKKVAEGVTGRVPYKGAVELIIDEYRNALIQSMRVYQGVTTLVQLQKNARFSQQTQFGKYESGTRILPNTI